MKTTSKLERANIYGLIHSSMKAEYALLEEEMEYQKKALDIDEGDVIDPDDLSHQAESTDHFLHAKHRLLEYGKEFKTLELLENVKTQIVRSGSVVNLGDRVIFVGVTAKSIHEDEVEVIGAHETAPFVKEMLGKREGDKFEFNNQKFEILQVC